jgi:PAS domain S-box-containing protein
MTLNQRENGTAIGGRHPSALIGLPLPLLLVAILALWAWGPAGEYEFAGLQLVLNSLTRTAASLAIMFLAGRSFLASRSPAMLLLGGGVAIWGAAGFSATLLVTRDANEGVTISNVGYWLAALCHLSGALLSSRPGRILRAPPALWLGAAYALALGATGLLTLSVLEGRLPLFFVQGEGGTPVRDMTLSSSILMFVLAALHMRLEAGSPSASFRAWYCTALLLIAIGLFGMLIQDSRNTALDWACRAAIYLSGLYMLGAAAQTLRRPDPAFEAALGRAPDEARFRYGVATAITLASAVARLALRPIMGASAPFVTFYPAVMLASLYGGLGPGLTATALSALFAACFWLEPINSLGYPGPADWPALTIFLMSGSGIAFLCHALHRARARTTAVEAEAAIAAERARAADRLRASEELYRSTLQALPAHIAVIDRQGVIVAVNQAWTDFARANDAAGLASVSVGANYLAVCRKAAAGNNADAEKALDGIGSVLRGSGAHFTLEYACHSPLEQRWFLMTAVPFGSPHEGGAVITHLNVTERRRAEDEAERLHAAVAQEKDRLMALVNSISDEIWFSNDKGAFTLINPSASRAFALGGADSIDVRNLVGRLDVFGPDGSPRPVEEAPPLRALRGETIRNEEELIRNPATGEMRYREVSSSPVTNAAGTIIGSVSVARDITERKGAESALRDSRLAALSHLDDVIEARSRAERIAADLLVSEERFRLALRNAPVSVAAQDRDLRYLWAYNQRSVPGSEIAGKTDHDLFPAEEAARLTALKRRVLETESEVREQIWLTVDERRQFMDLHLEPSRSPGGAVIGIAIAAVDLTHMKLAEESLRRTAEELARSNHDLEQFAHVASHDLKEPLRMVTAFTELLRRDYAGSLDEQAGEYIGFAADAATRMQRLVDDLLTYARVGRDRITATVDVGRTVEAALANLRLSLEEAGASVDCGPLPTLQADELELTQLFQNLIGNAVKFRSPARPALVRIRATPAPPNGPAPGSADKPGWLFSVQDNGIGLDPKYADRIFAIFQRLHTGEEYPGTGVGLAICKKIVDRHGGRIWVESTPGTGSTFLFVLPARD